MTLPPYPDAVKVIPLLKLTGNDGKPLEPRSEYERGIRLLKNVGALKKVGGRLKVVMSKLNRELPDVYDLLTQRYE